MQMQPLPQPSRCVHTPVAPGTRAGTRGDTSIHHPPFYPLTSYLLTSYLPSYSDGMLASRRPPPTGCLRHVVAPLMWMCGGKRVVLGRVVVIRDGEVMYCSLDIMIMIRCHNGNLKLDYHFPISGVEHCNLI